MLMSVIWVVMLAAAVLCGAATGNSAAVGTAALEGAKSAVEFCLGVGALICLWSGVMEVLKRSGLSAALARLLRPVLARLFPRAAGDGDTMESLASNVAANLLGLGSAATPMGIRAAEGMRRLDRGDAASDELCLLVVVNTASIQLLPTTIAAVRAQAGAAEPFDILPAVWLSSLVSVVVGILAAAFFRRIWRLRGR